MFEKLRLDNLKLNAGKCHFFCRQLRYCGHIISVKGVSTDPKFFLEKLKDWPLPQNSADVQQFLGFPGYYRRFVENFSKIAKPAIRHHRSSSKEKRSKAS